MRIIKYGRAVRLGSDRKFECKICGSIFVATKDEYQARDDFRNGTFYECICPCCGRMAYADENSFYTLED